MPPKRKAATPAKENTNPQGNQREKMVVAASSKKSIDRKERFTLLVYEKDKQKGVVETKDIPAKSRVQGAIVNAPNPIDWFLQEGVKCTEKIHKAKVVSFGDNIDFLYDLPVLQDGTLAPQTALPELLASKRLRTHLVHEANKKSNIWQIDQKSAEIPKILNLGGNTSVDSIEKDSMEDGNGTYPESNNSLVNSSSFLAGSVDSSEIVKNPTEDGIGVLTPAGAAPTTITMTVATNLEATANTITINLENSDEDEDSLFLGQFGGNSDTTIKIDNEDLVADTEVHCEEAAYTCQDNDNCPLAQLLNNAKPSEIEILERYHTALTAHKAHRNTSFHGDLRTKNCAQTSRSRSSFEKISTKNIELNFNEFECSRQDENKWCLVKNKPVFITKSDYLCLPGLTVATGSESQQHASTSQQKQHITPMDMIKLLVKILVPTEKWPQITVSNIPHQIVSTFTEYINMRLPENHRIKAEAVRGKIYNVCRGVKRDRSKERQRRQEKEELGIPITKRKKRQQADQEPFIKVPLSSLIPVLQNTSNIN